MPQINKLQFKYRFGDIVQIKPYPGLKLKVSSMHAVLVEELDSLSDPGKQVPLKTTLFPAYTLDHDDTHTQFIYRVWNGQETGRFGEDFLEPYTPEGMAEEVKE